MRAAVRHAILLGVAVVGFPGVAGCDRSSSQVDRERIDAADDAAGKSAASERPAEPQHTDTSLSPLETVEKVHQLRVSGKLGLVEPYVVPDQRAAVLELIQAVDRLEQAELVLQAAVQEHLGRARAQTIEHGHVADIIGVFSKNVTVVDERVEGDRAVVTVQVAERVPLDRVDLVRRDGRWLIRTDPPIEGLAEALRKLADVWTDIARRVRDKQLTADKLDRELAARQAPIMRRIRALTKAAGP